MKKKYVAPELEIVDYDFEDIADQIGTNSSNVEF